MYTNRHGPTIGASRYLCYLAHCEEVENTIKMYFTETYQNILEVWISKLALVTSNYLVQWEANWNEWAFNLSVFFSFSSFLSFPLEQVLYMHQMLYRCQISLAQTKQPQKTIEGPMGIFEYVCIVFYIYISVFMENISIYGYFVYCTSQIIVINVFIIRSKLD